MMKLKAIFLGVFFFFSFGISTVLGQSQNNDNEKIKNMLAKKRTYNKRNGFGYRIQLYNGNEYTARRKQARFRVEFPNIRADLKYQAPEWKVQVGSYKTKLIADKFLMQLEGKFSGAIVVPMSKR